MAENDIYNNQGKYEKFKSRIPELVEPIRGDDRKRKFLVKNKDNLQYFYKLCEKLETKDVSYIRRLRIINSLKVITHVLHIDIKDVERDHVDNVMRYVHQELKWGWHSKKDFINHLKLIWKLLFPEKDEKGRIDDSIIPYVVRHLSGKIDKSRQKRKRDKLTFQEVEKLISYFSSDPRMQLFISLVYESLARPQELCYIRIGDVRFFDNYAKIWISEHGKEGTGFLQCIDSHAYLLKWLEVHPRKSDDEAFLFCHTKYKAGQQINPFRTLALIKKAAKDLGISKPITNYSFKRNGVTHKRLNGVSDVQIQHTARWTSTDQLKTYDISDQDDVFEKELVRRGLKDGKSKSIGALSRKRCSFCDTVNTPTAISCKTCVRPLTSDRVKQLVAHEEDLNFFFEQPEVQELFKMLVYKLRNKTRNL